MRLCRYKYVLVFAFAMLIASFSHAQQDENWQKQVDKYLATVEGERKGGIQDTGEYLSAIYELSILYYEKGQWDEVVVLSLEADSLFRQYFSSITGLHISLLARLANAFSAQQDYYRAASAQLEMISLEEFVYENGGVTIDEHIVRLPMIVDDYRVLASYTRQISDKETTIKALLYACFLMEKNNIVDSCKYAENIYYSLYNDYLEIDSLDLAAQYYTKEYHACQNTQQKRTSLIFATMGFSMKGYSLIAEKGDFNAALRSFLICDSIMRLYGEDTSELFFINQVDIANCYEVLGDPIKALTILEEIKPLIISNLGYGSEVHFKCLTRLADLYYYTKNDNNVNTVRQERLDIKDSLDFDEDIYKKYKEEYYFSLLYDVAMLYESKGNVDSAISYFNKMISLYTDYKGDTCMELIMPYSELLVLYNYLGEKKLFDSIINAGNRIFEVNKDNPEFGRLKIYSAITMAKIATTNRWDKAEDLWRNAVNTIVETGFTGMPFYLDALVAYVEESFINGHIPEQIFQRELMVNNIYQYAVNYTKLSSVERDAIVNSPMYLAIRNLVFSLICNSTNWADLYDYTLFCKQQTLNTDIEFAKNAVETNNEQVLDYLMTSKVGGSAEDAHKERLLRGMVQQHYNNSWLSATYDSVRQQLGEKDVAIEYVRFKDCHNISIDNPPTEKYFVLLARKDWDEPRYIPLCKADDLKKYTSLTSEKIYGGGYVSEEIVRLLFDPIKEYTKKGGHVYFAPDGVLYNLAVENILTDGGMTLGEKYGLVRCSSTRNIAQIDNQPQYASAVLYGGLDYGNGTDYVAEATTRKGWNYLPGTLEEVTTIGNVLNRHKIKTETFTGQQGTEYSFVQLSGKKNSVIHLATHGFFYSVSSSRKETFFDKLRGGDLAQFEEISPMQRSGLLLSNGNKTWMSEKESEGSEDGVLLASEVMNMNLFGTSLLVLSACETGLGDMSVEGIMGLQRAFKLSGVETIVMSLWEVDDEATTMMMEQFYENLMSGKSKRKAFSLAQQKVRKKYPAEPKKWAAFIMLD